MVPVEAVVLPIAPVPAPSASVALPCVAPAAYGLGVVMDAPPAEPELSVPAVPVPKALPAAGVPVPYRPVVPPDTVLGLWYGFTLPVPVMLPLLYGFFTPPNVTPAAPVPLAAAPPDAVPVPPVLPSFCLVPATGGAATARLVYGLCAC